MTTLECLERETGPQPTHAIIWMHGLGADGNDFFPIVPELLGAGMPACRFVFPHAPVRPVSINQGMPMRAWYDIFAMDLVSREDADGVRTSQEAIKALIEREHLRGIPYSNIVLAGFSQGCAMALYTGVRLDKALAGIIGLSGYLPLMDTTAQEYTPANLATPIFLGHGTMDPVVALGRGQAARDTLLTLGYQPQWHAYPMMHAVCPQEIADIRAFLKTVLS
ncbi:carboxylesterase [Alcaligenaceae bacterium CGII-47]|nr:carboxylesterase [Alcaligenaceae bacterium CGII-47]